jgi:excisionase family DNA binding protein
MEDNTTLQDLPALFSPREAAKLLRVCSKTVHRWIGEGRLRSIKVTPGLGSGRRLIRRQELERFLDEAEG